ncbi:flagellin-specific chaperone FliS-like protein [Rhizorhabdus wittichii DC-6]|uniref:Flagellin-specific chaperone FliS-like protein n=4 Tax=Rhizorhabdus wittichii TaxID=160791 RepID=A0A9J9H7Y7_RHIWR|nr:Flagellin-specific chaperone FliS-like protein [Rhizorhabdus wittichii RW1]ARR56845.1 flagellin-specific chaperone FliS-like protein [Rhizorhabdus wittichii DC-6]QTH22536.1 flagellar protein FliS [Rhizorhabdus wittichii]
MYMSHGYGSPMNGAKLRYQTVDVDSRVEGASPHRLIGILFEELMKALEIMTAAQRAGMTAKAIDRQARASNILLALETSLDYRNGGEIAVNLAKIYREARRLVRLGGRDNQPELVDRARSYLAEIVEAWEAIG